MAHGAGILNIDFPIFTTTIAWIAGIVTSSACEPPIGRKAYMWVFATAAAFKSRIVVWRELTLPKLHAASSIAGAD
jgi:hypothetical protein